MKRNRCKIVTPYVDWLTPNCNFKEPYVHKNVYKYALNEYGDELNQLYCGDLYVLPFTPDGEVYRDFLYQDCWIGYGAYEKTFEYCNKLYIAILVNND